MDDEAYSQLEAYLLFTMKSDASMVERSGAAQGLGEVSCVAPMYVTTVGGSVSRRVFLQS
jgi:hypothetical protein